MSKRPDTLTPLETSKFLESIRMHGRLGSRYRNGCRNYLMCLLMLDAGLRVGEVVKLELPDLFIYDRPVSSLLVRKAISKSKCDRLLPLSNRIRESIVQVNEKWWTCRAPIKGLFAFFSVSANHHLSTRQVERIVSRHAKDSIDRDIHPHVLRHTFATRLMRQVNARVVQELLGHKNIQTTMLYEHPNHEDLTNAIEKISTE